MSRPRSRRTRGLMLAGGALLAAAAVPAIAATPESGSVSKATPNVAWAGTITGSYFARIPVIVTDDDTVPCVAPTCDAFALEVKDSDDLLIGVEGPTSTGTTGSATQATFRVRKPDGSVVITTGDTGEGKPLTTKIRKAPTGSYDVEYWAYFVANSTYTGFAKLGSPAPVAPPPPAPAPGPAPQPQPQSQPNQDITITAKVARTSAKALNKSRRLKATVTFSRAIASGQATLTAGRRVLAKAAIGRTAKSAALALKLKRKVKPGTLKLTVSASDGAGVTAVKSFAVKVRK